MDAETKEYIDQKFKLLTKALAAGFKANDGEHGRLYDLLKTMEDVIRALDPKADQERPD